MLDLQKTITLIKDALLTPEKAWESYLPESGDWQKTMLLLTGPLIIVCGVLAYVLGNVFPSRIPFMPSPTFMGMILALVGGLISACLVAFVFSTVAGLFKGTNSFPRALAATSLAFVPGYLGQFVAKIPFVGPLLALALFVYSLVLLWKILPSYLQVPETSRVGHYILSLVLTIVASIILGATLGKLGLVPSFGGITSTGSGNYSASNSDSGGMFGSVERAGNIMNDAKSDVYDPPSDGELSSRQVKDFIRAMEKTNQLRETQAQELKELSERADKDELESLGEIFSGMGNVMKMTSAEMEVVKTGGGNWAEHLWVKEQLRVAIVQRDINDAVKHNYELYQEFESELTELESF